ncbi:THUMP domain-containing protein 2, partial [Columba livia]|uniref:THUMP domain-containing protein 2 n=1 Tax=Columba livia TaxID=8932 RepID=UPI0031BB9134
PFCKVSGGIAAVHFSDSQTCLYSAALPLPSESFDAVISDIVFGKAFKITKDIQLLPDILQEMERYMWPLTCLGFAVNVVMVCDIQHSVSFRFGLFLGKTDAFIYRYRKISTAGNQQLSCTVPM